ncbi:GGDEF domain-containing protein [Colwelliaceae bacterium 6441]
MQKLLHTIFPFQSFDKYSNSDSDSRYQEWDKPARLVQISSVCFLTAVLYLIFTFIGKSWAPEPIQDIMFHAHIFINMPLLLLISLLARHKQFYHFVLLTLAIYSLVSLSIHSYIVSLLPSFTPFLVEGYLGVLWIFIVSGLTFNYALSCAIFGSAILIGSASYYMTQSDDFVIHVFWILCSFSFGILGALIFDRSRKAVFFTQQKLQKLAVTDPLTGAYNRNKMNQIVSGELNRASRYKHTFGLLMIDIDHFKNVNDSFGHDIGDKVLKTVASLLSSTIRDNDILIRWGGEEFIVIALEFKESNLETFCEKLRKVIEQETFATVGSITISIGATLFKEHDTQDTMLKRADKALYHVKAQGRNNWAIE